MSALKLKYVFVFAVYLTACTNSEVIERIDDSALKDKERIENAEVNDAPLMFEVLTNYSDSRIHNSSKLKVDLLFSSIDYFRKYKRIPAVEFHTECMFCESVETTSRGLLFAKRLLLDLDSVCFFKEDTVFGKAKVLTKLSCDYRSNKSVKYPLQLAKSRMDYIGQSCMDADYHRITLRDKLGTLQIDSVLNPFFVEYDLDGNGIEETFLFGSRNCSQELIVFRIY